MTGISVPTDGPKQAEAAGEHAISAADIGTEIILLFVIDTDHLNELDQPGLRGKNRKRLSEEKKDK